MAKKKTFYYHEDQKDDFGGIGVNHKPLPDNYKYIHKNIFFRFFSFILYYFLAFPILYIVSKFYIGIKVYGKKNIKQLKRKQGFFFSCNHCHYYDAFISHVFIGVPRRTYIVSNADPVRIPFIRFLVEMLGVLPLPNSKLNYRNYYKAMEVYVKKGSVISIYPEATIWPYYNKMRPFSKASFKYPAMLNQPIVIGAETFRKPKFFKGIKPRMNLTISKVIYPDSKKTVAENTEMFYQAAISYWNEQVVLNEHNVAFHHYLPLHEEKEK